MKIFKKQPSSNTLPKVLSHDWNAFVLFGGIFIMRKIKLTKGQFALVDDEDFEYLNQFKWQAHKHGRTYYAVRTGKNIDGEMRRKSIRMHRVIKNVHVTDKREIDHIDNNPSNNDTLNLQTLCANCHRLKSKLNNDWKK